MLDPEGGDGLTGGLQTKWPQRSPLSSWAIANGTRSSRAQPTEKGLAINLEISSILRRPSGTKTNVTPISTVRAHELGAKPVPGAWGGGLPCWVRQILCPWAGDAPGELVMSKTSELVADILWLLCGSCVQMRSSQSPVTTNNGTVSSMASCAE